MSVNSNEPSATTPPPTVASSASDAANLALEPATQRSLFGEILDWMLMPLLLLWPVSIGVTYLVAKSIANEPFDRALEDRVTVLAQQVKEVNGELSAQLPFAARDILRADDIDNVYFQVVGPQHEIIAGDIDLPRPDEEDNPVPWNVQLRDAQMRNGEVRIAYTYVSLKPIRTSGFNRNTGSTRLALVQVGETLEKRRTLANQIIKGVILPEFIILPIAITLLWFALSRGLSPLTHLQDSIRSRRPDDLSPIDSRAVPEEISPLVKSLNDMLSRLSQSIQSQKRFIADAAHQMKTPLAGMRMQSELAMRQIDSDEIQRSLAQLAKSSASATRLVNQLLALARAENEGPQRNPMQVLSLVDLARSAVQDWFAMAQTRAIDLGFECDSGKLTVLGNPIMLREMINNLLDNALRYTQEAGRVTLRVRREAGGQHVLLEVEDDGPGIPSLERSQVFERFYRILGSDTEGSGLGLAIVREIAQGHSAELSIYNNPRCRDPAFPGCLFRIRLPSAPEAGVAT